MEKDFFVSSLPVVYIDTNDSVDITSKEDDVKCRITIQGNGTFEQ